MRTSYGSRHVSLGHRDCDEKLFLFFTSQPALRATERRIFTRLRPGVSFNDERRLATTPQIKASKAQSRKAAISSNGGHSPGGDCIRPAIGALAGNVPWPWLLLYAGVFFSCWLGGLRVDLFATTMSTQSSGVSCLSPERPLKVADSVYVFRCAVPAVRASSSTSTSR